MEWKEFAARVIDSLAWPTCVLALVLLLRQPIHGLVPLLQRLKYKDFEMEFGRRVEEIKDEVASELPTEPSQKPLATVEDKILGLAEFSPRAAVLEAWREVETAALAAARRISKLPFDQRTHVYHAFRLLESMPNVDRSTTGALRELRALRNEAAHAPEFALTKQSAIEYAMSAQAIAARLRRLDIDERDDQSESATLA
jgi:hypothetical protein